MKYEDIYDKCKKIVIDYLRLESDEIKPDTHMVIDLCADSIALVELSFRISETFSIPVLEPDENLFVFKNMVYAIQQRVELK